MENIAAKNKSFRNLKILFLISLIVTILAFINLVVVTALAEAGAFNQPGAGQVAVVFEWIFSVLKALVVIGIIVVVLIGSKCNKLTKTSVWLALGCVVFGILGFCLQAFAGQWILGNSFTLVGSIFYCASVFVFVDGLLETKWRDEPWVKVIMISLGIMLVAQILFFLSTSIKVGRSFNGVLGFTAATLFVVANLFLYVSIRQIGKNIKMAGEIPAEVK